MTEPETSQYKKSGDGTENESPPPAQHPKDAQKMTHFSKEQVSYLRSVLKECVSEATKEVRPSDRTLESSQPKGEC